MMSEGYLEYGQKTLVKAIEVASRFLGQRVIIKPCSKDLHAQQSEDTHEQK